MSVSLIELKKLEAAYKNSLKALHENLQVSFSYVLKCNK